MNPWTAYWIGILTGIVVAPVVRVLWILWTEMWSGE